MEDDSRKASLAAQTNELGESAKAGVGNSSARFRPVYRLRKTDEYSSVFAFRRALRSDHLMLHFKPAEGLGARLGVVVAKKLVKRAVARNLIKRLARESFRAQRLALPAYDLILRVARPTASVSRAALRGEIQSLFKKLPAR